jgi:hypothetical protein
MIPLLRLLSAVLPALLLAGCAAAPTGPAFTMRAGDRIGLLVETSDTPVHTHYQPEAGNSVRSARSYPFDWRLDAAVSETVERQLTLAGFTVVDLERRGLRHADLAGLVQQSGSQWLPAADPVVAQLREQGVRAVVLVKDARAIAERDCNGGPCQRVAEGPGLYSTSAGGVTSWRAVAAFDWHVYLLEPPGDLAAAQPLRNTLEIPSVPLFGFAQPRNPAALSEAELAPVREKVLEYVEATAEDVVLVLGGRRVVEQGASVVPVIKSR